MEKIKNILKYIGIGIIGVLGSMVAIVVGLSIAILYLLLIATPFYIVYLILIKITLWIF